MKDNNMNIRLRECTKQSIGKSSVSLDYSKRLVELYKYSTLLEFDSSENNIELFKYKLSEFLYYNNNLIESIKLFTKDDLFQIKINVLNEIKNIFKNDLLSDDYYETKKVVDNSSYEEVLNILIDIFNQLENIDFEINYSFNNLINIDEELLKYNEKFKIYISFDYERFTDYCKYATNYGISSPVINHMIIKIKNNINKYVYKTNNIIKKK